MTTGGAGASCSSSRRAMPGATWLLRARGTPSGPVALIPVSAIGLAGFVALSAQATFALFPTSVGAGVDGATLSNPALLAMWTDLEPRDRLDRDVQVGAPRAVFLALLAYVVVRRHTRTEEEAGRLELLGAGVVGRRPLAQASCSARWPSFTVLLTVVWSVAVGLDGAARSRSVSRGSSRPVVGRRPRSLHR